MRVAEMCSRVIIIPIIVCRVSVYSIVLVCSDFDPNYLVSRVSYEYLVRHIFRLSMGI